MKDWELADAYSQHYVEETNELETAPTACTYVGGIHV